MEGVDHLRRAVPLEMTSRASAPASPMSVSRCPWPQIIDVDIDKVNKPELPIAAGRLSTAGATGTVLVCLLIGCWLGLMPAAYGSLGLAVGDLFDAVPLVTARHDTRRSCSKPVSAF